MTETLARGYPGMKSIKDMPVAQDGPPPGGFPAIRYARRIPNTGPTGATIFGVAALLMGYGFYRMINNNHLRRAERREVQLARIALTPMLQAEEDRRYVEEMERFKEREARVMKDVPGWTVGESVYKTRWMPPPEPMMAWSKYNDYPRS